MGVCRLTWAVCSAVELPREVSSATEGGRDVVLCSPRDVNGLKCWRAVTSSQRCGNGLLDHGVSKAPSGLVIKARNTLEQCFSTVVRPRPGKFFFYNTRARS